MKALFLYTLSLFLFCSASLADTLTIYSYRHYESDVLLFNKFTEQTGIEVEVVKSKAGALLERLKAEVETYKAEVEDARRAALGRLEVADAGLDGALVGVVAIRVRQHRQEVGREAGVRGLVHGAVLAPARL